MESKKGPAQVRWPVPGSLALTVATAVAATVTGCGLINDAPPPGGLDELRRIASTCEAKPPATMVRLDGTGSSDSEAIKSKRLDGVEEIARETAVCGGRLRVEIFGPSSAGAVELFDDTLKPHGATTNSRLRRVPELVDKTMTQIRGGYDAAVAELPSGGSDITSQLRLAGEWHDQLGEDYRLHVVIFTDGFQTVGGVNFYKEPLSPEKAAALAEKASVPKLSGASVIFAGLGNVAGKPPKSAVVEGLVAYFDSLCKRTKADECTSVTDYAVGR
ncbi:hypothetical protein [Streptomyces sp. PR69]|uniref:hypothetical protein n=1 Tax=Streptomyces sp. PR69 TaxID=2984950 RepID=UPI002264E6EC|nr:hypothetical protein [Streptomyces sp. PR69]